MYPIERLLGTYKRYVRNKARPEERNEQGSEPNAKVSIFSQRVRPTGKELMVELPEKELELANWFIFNNCDEIEGFRNEHEELLKEENIENIDQRHMTEFP
ncbi:hypothetical protein M0R45_035679 [Rubus argutus]|uniref:Uncharacterized protein n=1 Tax=Rubus argutus TaxID=59490 RepID=A0AAW1VWE3_RUBAR